MSEPEDPPNDERHAAEGDLRVSREDSYTAEEDKKGNGMDAEEEGTPLLPD